MIMELSKNGCVMDCVSCSLCTNTGCYLCCNCGKDLRDRYGIK